jgi:serine/threonine protein kinase
MPSAANWTVITESQFPHEREALEFVRDRFPSHEPYRAWTNFTFLALDGSINEVDLLVFSPSGFFLVEIKSHPGRLSGDAGTWTWENEGRRTTVDNPIFLADLKAKKLKSLLERQRAARSTIKIPRIEAAVFCSASGLQVDLPEAARARLLLRDRSADPATGAPERPGIAKLLTNREGPGFPAHHDICDRPAGKAVAEALKQAGIRPRSTTRQVGDYILGVAIDEGPGFQDFRATHKALPTSLRRVRLYSVDTAATPEERNTFQRAALREFQLLESLDHPGILRAQNFTAHELGPAVLFDHDPREIRLDHYLAQRGSELSVDARLSIIRQIAEAIRHAHEKRIIHRGLSPKSILVLDDPDGEPRIKIFNWQIGCRDHTGSTLPASTHLVTTHIESLTDRGSAVYQAPEVHYAPDTTSEQVDVFSLGAIAYNVLSGSPPASGLLELGEKLRVSKGLALASVVNGAQREQDALIRWATHPEVAERLDSAANFLKLLDEVEDSLTRTLPAEHEPPSDPTRARPDDVLDAGDAGTLTVKQRLGRGACSVAMFVHRGDDELVLKLALSPEHNDRIRKEAETLGSLAHERIVRLAKPVEIEGLAGFLMEPVYANRAKRLIETLADRLRSEGRLQIDFLERFGTDLLEGLHHLEARGVFHRDIKPDNIAIRMGGRDNSLHLVLFDFSLADTPLENLRAGTVAYLDPFLSLRPLRRYDRQAEHWAAAMTLHEMATRARPTWGNDGSDPAQLDCEITLQPESFESAIRPKLTAFFTRAFKRAPSERFDNAEQMLDAWKQVFDGLDRRASTDAATDDDFARAMTRATFETPLADLGLSTRALGALDRIDVITVDDLLRTHPRRLLRLPGVGHKTRREIGTATKLLREKLGEAPETPLRVPGVTATAGPIDPATLPIEAIVEILTAATARESKSNKQMAAALLGLDATFSDPWPNQTAVARHVGVTPPYVSHLVTKLQGKLSKHDVIRQIRDDLAAVVAASGNVMTVDEAAAALVAARGSSAEGDEAIRRGRAIVRGAYEVERAVPEPRFSISRSGDRILLATSDAAADWAVELGTLADEMAEADPLLPPASIAARLRTEAPPPPGTTIDDTRLIRLAAAASRRAAVSSKQELYPRGMSATRALRLAQGAIISRQEITPEEIREVIRSRYPEAIPLPDHPALGMLLTETGCEFDWLPEEDGSRGTGRYKSRLKTTYTVTSGSRMPTRLPTDAGHADIPAAPATSPTGAPSSAAPASQLSPAALEARQFDTQLARAAKDGQFVAILVPPKFFAFAAEHLAAQYGLATIDVEGELLDAMQALAKENEVPWNVVVAADDPSTGRHWENLCRLARQAGERLKEKLLAERRPLLLIRAAILARYDLMDVLTALQQSSGTRGGVPGVWLLLSFSSDDAPRLDGVLVPLEGVGQRAILPLAWVKKHMPREPRLEATAP